jgi:PAS domain-containing protein
LTFYSVAAGLSICLCLVLSIFAYFQPGTLIIRSWTLTVFVLSIGFTISGTSPTKPTEWLTVFGYIIFMSLMTVCVMWMEVKRLKKNRPKESLPTGRFSGFIEYFSNKLLLLWSAVTVLIVSAVSMLGVGYVSLREVEKSRLIHNVELVNDALVDHTIQISGQVDTILRAVRGYYQQTRSIKATESFIDTLGFDRSVIDNIYLIGPDGKIIITHDASSPSRSAADRGYFRFHLATDADLIFISEVEPGRVTGKPHFRITRRLKKPDGSFGGLVLATVTPESFTRYYRNLAERSDGFAALIGISDRKLRARVPEAAAGQWSEKVVSPLWELLKQAPSGRYENTSQFDNIRRLFVYKKVGSLPLVVVTGFSNNELKVVVWERMSLLVLVLFAILLFTLLLALLLTIESKRRDELRHAGELLKRSELRLQEAQAVARIGDWEFDPETGQLNYSDQMYELINRDHGEGPPHISEAVAMFHPDDAPDVERCFRAALETGAGWQHDARVLLPDGRIMWNRGTGKTLLDEHGKVVKIYGTTQDITKDKMMESELKALNENLLHRVEEETSIRVVVLR